MAFGTRLNLPFIVSISCACSTREIGPSQINRALALRNRFIVVFSIPRTHGGIAYYFLRGAQLNFEVKMGNDWDVQGTSGRI